MKDWDIQINYGIKTGFNDAFIISTEKRNEILDNCSSDEERQRTAELIRPLTYHMGRHSFSTLITLENGVPIETVSKMLGHSDIKTTQVYARVTPKKLFEDMDKYIEATKELKLIL